MTETYAPAKGKLREVNFLKRVRMFRGIGGKQLKVHLDWTPKTIIESSGPKKFKKEIEIMKDAMREYDEDLKEHIDDWKQKHTAVKKLLNFVKLYMEFWEWLGKEVKKYPDNWKENCEFPSPRWFSWDGEFSRHTIRVKLKEIEDKLIHARKKIRKDYGINL